MDKNEDSIEKRLQAVRTGRTIKFPFVLEKVKRVQNKL